MHSYSVDIDGFRESTRESDGEKDTEERLRTLQSLYDQRLITVEEYEQKKKEILKEL